MTVNTHPKPSSATQSPTLEAHHEPARPDQAGGEVAQTGSISANLRDLHRSCTAVDAWGPVVVCDECGEDWPCCTIRILDLGEQVR